MNQRPTYPVLPAVASVVFALCFCTGCSTVTDLLRKPVPLPKSAELTYSDDFSQGLGKWKSEGVGELSIVGGRAVLDPRKAESGLYQARNLWFTKALPMNFRIEMDIHPLEPEPAQKEPCNLMFVFCAQMVNPELNVIEESANRDQNYIWLTGVTEWLKQPQNRYLARRDIPPMQNYTISYYRIDRQGNTSLQLRRNPGYHLLLEVPQVLPDLSARSHHIVIEKIDRSIKFYEDGRLWFEHVDDARQGPVLDGGYFCLRSFRTRVAADNFRVHYIP